MNNNDLMSFIDDRQFRQFIVENTTDVFWVLDENRNTTFISPSIFTLTGYTAYEFMHLDSNHKFSEASNEKLNHFFEKIDNLTEFRNLFIEYIAKNGELILTEVSGVVLRDEYGRFKGVYGLTVDISDKQRLENELSAEKEKSSEAEKFKSIILGIVGHEFRTPLGEILGFTKVLSQSLPDPDEQEILGYIYQSAQRLNATLNSVVTLAALESDQLEMKQEKIDMEEIIQNIYQSFEPIIKNKSLSLETNINSDYEIHYDENCLYQILYHLLDNAVKFTEKGQVRLNISTMSNGVGNYLELNVQDTGIGIKKQKVGTIFEPFRQLSEGHNRKFEGLGIGLTTTKKLVEKLNGSITVTSKINQGSQFTVKLPIKTSEKIQS